MTRLVRVWIPVFDFFQIQARTPVAFQAFPNFDTVSKTIHEKFKRKSSQLSKAERFKVVGYIGGKVMFVFVASLQKKIWMFFKSK